MLQSAALALAAFALTATAQEALPAHEARTAPLAGPRIVAAPHTTIIERGFDGLVKPAEPTPEEAVLDLLSLSDAERAATRAVLVDRARVLDAFITNNIPLLTQFGVAAGTGNKKDQAALAYAALLKLKPLTDAGPLQDQIAAALSSENAARFETILKDYWDAYVADRRRVRKPDGTFPNRLEIMAGAKLESLGREGERAFKQMLGGGDLIYEYLFKGVDLRPEQAGTLREMVADFAQRTKGEPTNQQNVALFFRIMAVLEGAQKQRFATNIRGLSGQQPANSAMPGKAAPTVIPDEPPPPAPPVGRW